MKKALIAIALAGLASTASAKVAGEAHDLSATGPNAYLNGTLSACQYCHAPHNVNTGVTGAPLWNRNSVTTAFIMYTSATLHNPVAATPNANSMTCLSCHDGTSDMGATYVGARGFAAATPLTMVTGTTAVIGAQLGNDHPVSVRYVGGTGTNYALANNVVAAGFRLYTYGGVDYVECASCHDPHNQGVGGNFYPFLRVSKTTMCTTCHLY